MLDAPHAAMNTPPPWQDEHGETPLGPHSETPHVRSHGNDGAVLDAPKKKVKRDRKENNRKTYEKAKREREQAARVPGLEARIQELESKLAMRCEPSIVARERAVAKRERSLGIELQQRSIGG